MLNITLEWLEMIRTVHHPDLKYSRFLKASGTSSGLRATRTLWLSQRGQMGWAVTKQLKLLQKETDLTYPLHIQLGSERSLRVLFHTASLL